MIASWISHDNRKQRRAAKTRARRAGVELAIHRVSSEAVGGHLVALTMYLISPTKARLDELAAIEAAKNHVVRYIGSDKMPDEVTAADVATARQVAERERVVQVLTRNLLSTDIADIQFEMAIVAGMAPGGEDPIEHIVLSWPAGEHPTPEQVEEVLDTVLAVAGMSRHQAFAVLHGDTGNDHLHIALNRVDPVTGDRAQIGRNIERSIETLHQALAIIEHRQGWAAQDKALYRADATGCYERETGIKVRDANMLPCASTADQKRIRQWRAEQKVERKISSAARDFERRTGMESLQRRVIETAAPVLRDATNWQAAHRGLAREGMRYRLLTSGAVIVCGEREIAASTAWGGASAAKMIERLGKFEEHPNDLAAAPFNDRLIPKLHDAAEKRRAQQAFREERAALDQSVEHARDIVGDRYRRAVASDPLADTDALNDVRRRASADLAALREAIQRLEEHRRKCLRRKRKGREGDDPIDLEETEEEPIGMLIGGTSVPAGHTQVPIDDDYDVVEAGGSRRYYRGSALAFVEHRDRIDLHAMDDAALRQALRLAQSKWGAVSAIGDGQFIDRLARLAVEEGVTLTNPELRERMARMQANMVLEQQLDRIKQQLAVPLVEPPAPVVPQMPQLMFPDKLRADYAPEFARWIEDRADPAASPARMEARTYAIYVQPDLKRQLAELESQQFAFATELRRSALRWSSRQQKLLAEHHAAWDDAPPLEPFGRLPRLSDLMPSAEDLKRMPIEFAPLQPQMKPTVAGTRTPSVPSVDEQARDLDRRYRVWAERARRKQIEQIDRDRAAALRARVGDPASPPRHIARLLLREAARHRAPRSTSARETDHRDRQEIFALSYDPTFAYVLAQARSQDPVLLQMLNRVADSGDALGRVRVIHGRLDFSHVSTAGYDAGAQPPLEWIEADLRKIDFTRIRLTRRDGMVGLYDTDLLEATHHNHVGLLRPDVQEQLEVEWRLQRERDIAILAKMHAGEIAISARIDPGDRPYPIIDVPRGVTEAERLHVATMTRDAEVFIPVRETQHGDGAVEVPLDASPLMSAYRRSQNEKADPVIVRLLADRLRAVPRDAIAHEGHIEAPPKGLEGAKDRQDGRGLPAQGSALGPKQHDREWQR